MTVLTLAMVALLAAEAGPRVPGTRFRLGMNAAQVTAIGAFADVKAADAAGTTARQGPSRFFGIPGELTLYMREGQLARLRFVATGVSPHSAGYAEDQMRRMGIAPRCRRDLPGDRACDWRTAALNVHVVVRGDRLEVQADAWPPPAWAAAETLGTRGAAGRAAPRVGAAAGAAGAAAAAADTARGQAAGAARPAGAGGPAADTTRAQMASAARDTSATGPGATAPMAPTAGPPGATGAADPAQGRAQGAQGTAPAAGAARRTEAPATTGLPGALDDTPSIMLPDTLSISLTSRNSPDVWPRILSSPPIEYPEAAREQSVQGVVWVLALVEWDGKVIEASIDRGIPELDAAAIAWVSRSRFAPCTLRGDPCRFYVRVAVLFTLH